MEESITMTEILAKIIRSWKKVCLIALIVAALLGAFQAYRMISQARSPENTPAAIEERYQTAIENYETQKENLEKNLEKQKKALEDKREYAENSLLMAVNPYDKYTASIIFAFTNIAGDGAVQGAFQYDTSADYLLQTIRSQYMVLWQSIDLPRELGISRYAETKEKYLYEVISVRGLEGGLCSITAVGSSAGEAEELANAVYQCFQGYQPIIAGSSYAHGLSIVSNSTKNNVDDALITKHETIDNEIQSLENAIENLNTQLEELSEPEREAGYSIGKIVKSVVKYALLGAVLGIVLACFWFCCMCVFGNRAGSSYQVERITGVPFLGALNTPHNILERFANHIAGERSWTDRKQALRYLSEQIKALCPKGEQVLVLSTLSDQKKAVDLNVLSEQLTADGHTVKTLLDAGHNPEIIQAIHQNGAVLLAESLDMSRMGAVQDVIVKVRETEKQFLGFVMI